MTMVWFIKTALQMQLSMPCQGAHVISAVNSSVFDKIKHSWFVDLNLVHIHKLKNSIDGTHTQCSWQ